MEHPIAQCYNQGFRIVFPLVQHIGAPAKPLVAVGDEVLVEDKSLQRPEDLFSQCSKAQVSGKVKKSNEKKS